MQHLTNTCPFREKRVEVCHAPYGFYVTEEILTFRNGFYPSYFELSPYVGYKDIGGQAHQRGVQPASFTPSHR